MTNVSTIRYNERKNGVHKSQLVVAIPSGGRAVYLDNKPLSVNVISFLSFTIISQCSCVCKGIFCFGSFSGTESSFLLPWQRMSRILPLLSLKILQRVQRHKIFFHEPIHRFSLFGNKFPIRSFTLLRCIQKITRCLIGSVSLSRNPVYGL